MLNTHIAVQDYPFIIVLTCTKQKSFALCFKPKHIEIEPTNYVKKSDRSRKY